jgi:uncharacterized membrane protein
MSINPSKLSRRSLFAGAGTAGALAAAVSVLPGVKPAVQVPVVAALPKPERGGGYALSDHVKQYYKTAQV